MGVVTDKMRELRNYDVLRSGLGKLATTPRLYVDFCANALGKAFSQPLALLADELRKVFVWHCERGWRG